MEWLSSFSGKQGLPVLVFATILLMVVAFAVKKGVVSFNGKGLQVGQDLKTRSLIQAQFEYAKAKCEGMIAKLPKHLNVYHSKYVIARVEDQVQRAIVFNSMTADDPYLKSKQELIYQTIMKRVDDDFFKTDAFKDMVYSFVEDLFKELVRMKKLYD